MRMRPRAMVVIAMLLFVAGFVKANDDWWNSKYLYGIPPEDRLDDSNSFIWLAITESIKRSTDCIRDYMKNSTDTLQASDLRKSLTFCDSLKFYVYAKYPFDRLPKIDDVVFFYEQGADSLGIPYFKDTSGKPLDCLRMEVAQLYEHWKAKLNQKETSLSNEDDVFDGPICTANNKALSPTAVFDTNFYLTDNLLEVTVEYLPYRVFSTFQDKDKPIFGFLSYEGCIFTYKYRLECDGELRGKWVLESKNEEWGLIGEGIFWY